MTNLIRPSDTSEDLASRKGLVPFRMWANLTHEDTYIHGPFEFATINGRKSRDRVSLDDWKILAQNSSQYDNDAPKDDLPTYSVHVDRGVMLRYHSKEIATTLLSAASHHRKSGERTYW